MILRIHMDLYDRFRKNSFILITGNAVTGFGNSMYLVALLVFISDNFPHPVNIGLLQAAAYVPVFLLSVPAGFIADRARRVPIIAGTDLIRAIFLMLCAVLLTESENVHPLTFIIPMVFLNGVMQAFFTPAVISFILETRAKPVAEPGGLRRRGNRRPDLLSLRTGSGHLASLIGQAIGAGLYIATGIVPILLINAASFLLSSVSEFFLSEPQTRRARGDAKRSFAGLFAELRKVDSQGAPVLLYLASQTAGAAILVNLPFFVTETLSFSPSYLGFAMASLLGGSIISSLVLGFLGPAVSWTAAFRAALVAALCLTAAGFLPDRGTLPVLISLLLLLAIAGAGMGWIHITTIHSVHRLGAKNTAASRQGFLEAAATGILPVSYLLYGFIFEQLPLGTPWIMRSIGIGIVVISIALSLRAGKRLGVQG